MITATTSATTDPKGKALRSIPEWVALRERLDALEAFDLPPLPGAPEDEAGHLVESAIAAGKSAAQIVVMLAKMHAKHENIRRLHVTVTRLRSDLKQALGAAAVSHADDVLRHLDGQVKALLADATEVYERLGNVRSAEHAVDAGKLDAWRRLPEMAAAYEGLRLAQASVMNESDGMGRSIRTNVLCHIASPDAVDAEHIERRTGTKIRVETEGGWHERDPHPAPWPALHEAAGLKWLVDNPKAGAWVPTLGQLDEAEERIMQLAREVSTVHSKPVDLRVRTT